MRSSWLIAVVSLVSACDGCSRKPDATPTPTTTATTAPPPKRAADIRRDGNHLLGQSSLYLREHAHNPVDWHAWGPEALALAKTRDRPIFLSVGYASCHWCHVMASEVFEDDEVATLLNERFVSIKVDREERPDVDATYMDVVQSMTGSGGWPMTVLLTPNLKPFFGGTYFPKARFLSILKQSLEELEKDRAGVESRGAEIAARLSRQDPSSAGDRVRPTELKALAERSIVSMVDATWGGMKGRQKFPNPARWTFFLHAARKWGAPMVEPVRLTLDMMASGGLFDHVGGGFFRYSVDPSWTVPHFEKMLYVNASLARLYLEAHAAYGEPRDLLTATRTLDFLLGEMDVDGGFGASLDADSGGKEGAFYTFTNEELGADANLLGATDRGNFEGTNVVQLRDKKLDPKRWEEIRRRLASIRAQRARPTRDPKLVTAWNGLAIDALARGFAVTGNARYRDAAARTADFLWSKHRSSEAGLVRTSTSGKLGPPATLDDYAGFASGLVSLFEATGNTSQLERALTLAKEMQDGFARPTGGFFTNRAEGPIERRVDLIDSEEPCGTALAILTLQRLAALTGRRDLYELVDKALEADANAARRAGLASASWLDAALLESGPFYDVVIAGDGHTDALVKTWRALAPSWTVKTDVDGKGASSTLLPAVEGKVARGGVATAYVCVRGSCRQPTTDPAAFRMQLLDGWTR